MASKDTDADSVEGMEIDALTRKRKGGSVGEIISPVLKRHNSSPNIRESTLKAALASKTPSSSVADVVASSFTDKEFVSKITPAITEIIRPFITDAINDAVLSAVTAVEKTLFSKLKKDQDELSKRVDNVESKLKSTELLIKENDKKLNDKNIMINKLQAEVESLRIHTDDLEQYGRRQSIRLYNVPLEGCADGEEAALKMFNELMKVNVSADEIERPHPLGPKQLLVKFKSYKTKAIVYKAKSSLKDNDYGIFMTEDLTKRNHGIIKDLLLLKKSEQIHSFWTMDGKIYVKLEDSSKPKQIRNKSELTTPKTTKSGVAGSASASGVLPTTGGATATAAH